jgi:hypothetical protein
MDANVDLLRWVEMSMLLGYDVHKSDLDAVAKKFCEGNGNLTGDVQRELLKTFSEIAGPVKQTYTPLMSYLWSLKWSTSGSVAGVKETWSVDGDREEHRISKNMLIDWFTPKQMLEELMKQDVLKCSLAMKNEVGKQRPVVGADPWSYLVMSWVMSMIEDWVRNIPGFFVYVEGTALYDVLRAVRRGDRVVACRGDDIMVTLKDGRVFSFDFKEFDHQVPMSYVVDLWELIVSQMQFSAEERIYIDKVSFLLRHVVLYWYTEVGQHSRRMEGSLASGIRLTTIAGTSVSRAVAKLLANADDPWAVVRRLNLLFSRSKCYIRRGGEFLRCYVSPSGMSSYACRSVVSFLQHKPWLDGDMSRADATYKALFVTLQRLGNYPPHYIDRFGIYGCPKVYGGHGIGRYGWDFVRRDPDENPKVKGVPIENRAEAMVRAGLRDDIVTRVLSGRDVSTLYARKREGKVISGGFKPEPSGLGPVWPLVRYDRLKFRYWEEMFGWTRAAQIVAPDLLAFMVKHSRWGRRAALKLAEAGPEIAMCCKLWVDTRAKATIDQWPGTKAGSVRAFYRSTIETLSDEYSFVLRLAS